MWIKNYTNSDLNLEVDGISIKLTANATTLVPDGIITTTELQKYFGSAVAQVTSGPTTTILTNQQIVSTGKLYITGSVITTPNVRAWIEGGSVDIYGSDSTTIPTALSSMSLPSANTGVSGMASFDIIPKYLAFKVNTGTPSIVITNMKLIEVSTIA